MSGQGRRGFFASLVQGARALAAELEGDEGPRFSPPPATPAPPPARPEPRPARRPPGALTEEAFLAACTRCGACVEACPEHTLAVGQGGYPVAEPWRSACALCPSTPCISACAPGALVPSLPSAFRIGLAHVSERLCINGIDPDAACDRCLDWCPVPGAISAEDAPVPTVDPSLCTGCGLCSHGCPAYPKAITVR